MSRHTRRKAKRRAKVVTKRDHLKSNSLEKQDSSKGLAWEMARIMTKRDWDKTYVNVKSRCTKCTKSYCLGFNNVIQYCSDCFYFPCVKELQSIRTCRKCRREEDASND